MLLADLLKKAMINFDIFYLKSAKM